MKLRTKLLLGVGLLLFAMVLVMYILPTILIRRDVYKAANEIHQLLIAEHQQLIRSQQIWLSDALVRAKENNDALLSMLYHEPHSDSNYTFKNYSSPALWKGLARIVGYDPAIGFVQLHSPKNNQTAVINSSSAHLYPIGQVSQRKGYHLFSLLSRDGEKIGGSFVGVPLPEAMQQESGYTLYALIESRDVKEEMPHIKDDLLKATPDFAGKRLLNAANSFPSEMRKTGFLWSLKVEMIRFLTPMFAEGLTLRENRSIIPAGIVRVDTTGNGYGLLTSEVFSTTPIFDDVLYYKLNQPENAESLPLAGGEMLVEAPRQHSAYIGNTVILGENYFSIGTPLEFLAHQLALSSSKKILLNVNGNFWIGYDKNGNELPAPLVRLITDGISLDQKNGVIKIEDTPYFFSEIASLHNDRLIFYDLRALEGEQSIATTLLEMEDRLSRRISMQLSLISLATMILVLLFVGRIGYTVIYPVTKLAKATQDVVAGRYDEVSMPEMGNRQDEVAILTRSFEDMVEGLQEREKIRGVLDKVVSKDVADEILRTQIHLGGEDRVVTMLFSDIRDFTTISGQLSPQKTIHILNVCMTKVSRVIEGEGGIIDKYVGDEVMAIFGAPTTHPDHALRAVSSGMLIIENLKKWNAGRIAAGETPIEMGIGIHTGLVVAGNMGAEDRLNYTVLGAHVNLASRLCEFAKPNQLIISEATLSEPNVRESFYAKPLPPLTLKGFSSSVQIYEITGFKWEENPPEDIGYRSNQV